MRIELGGGRKPREGFQNCDMCEGADYQIDLEQPLPFADDSVEQLCSFHCLEHVENVVPLLNEICRVCKLGASVTIAVPHHGQEMAMCPGHLHVISEQMITHFNEFPASFWKGKKRLQLITKTYSPTKHLPEARRLFPSFTDEQIYRFVQNTCHEVTFFFRVYHYAT